MDPNAANTASFSNARSVDMLGRPFPVALGELRTDDIVMDAAVGTIENLGGSMIISANGVLSLLGSEIDCVSTKLTNVATPTASTDAATKGYVDAADALKANLSGATFSGAVSAGSNKIVSSAVPTSGSDLCNKTYVDAADALRLPLAGGTMGGALNMGTHKLTVQRLSFPFLGLANTGGTTSTQGLINWPNSIQSTDIPSHFGYSAGYITFPSTGTYLVSASATFSVASGVSRRQIYLEFLKTSTMLISVSQQVANISGGDAGTTYCNVSFNRAIVIDSTSGGLYNFNWGSFTTASGVNLLSESHAYIQQLC